MNEDLRQAIEHFAGFRLVVIGEAMLDGFLEGSSTRLCPEAPVPVLNLAASHDLPGGAANTAVNVQALGARVSLISVVGDDPDGVTLCQALIGRNVCTDQVIVQPGRRTLARRRVLASSQLLARLDQGDTGPLCPETEQAVIDRLTAIFPECDAMIVSDYGYGLLTPRVIACLRGLQQHRPRVLIVDSKRLVAYRDVGVTAVKPNYVQAMQLLGGPSAAAVCDRVAEVQSRGHQVLDHTGAAIAAVTLDADGALIFERGRPPYRTYARPRLPSRSSGAGDTFVAALALGLAAQADAPVAAELASAAAGVVSGKERTAACSAAELRDALLGESKLAPDLAALTADLDLDRAQGRRVVFTNGCFDILHRGHVTYLSRAKALGDILVIGVNSDAGIRRLKGPGRPINTLEDRVHVLAALSCVDRIVAFDEDTPHRLIRAVRPHVFVKGGDYTRDRLPEASLVEELGGVVRILPFMASRSTTGIIERIRGAEGKAGPVRQWRRSVLAQAEQNHGNGRATK